MVQEISHVNFQNKYIIPNHQNRKGKWKLNMQVEVKTKNGKNLKVKALVDSGCTYTEIDKQLVKDKKIQTKLLNFSFEVFNADRMKNGEVTRVTPLDIEINSYKEQLEVTVKNETIKFTRCPGSCTIKHKDIRFKTRRTKAMEITEQDNGEIGKELDNTNSEDLLDYI